jgi:hypothetical protein
MASVPAGTPVVVSEETSESLEAPRLDISLDRPVVSGLTTEAAAAINAAIETEAVSRSEAFRSGVEAASPEDTGPPSSYVFSFEVTAATAEILSIRFHESTYFQGAEAGNSGVFTLSFDPVTGAPLSLTDVVVEGGAAQVADLAQRHVIDEIHGGEASAFHDHAPAITPQMLHHWNVSASGVEISFDPETVGPAWMGPVTVVVPYSELSDSIDPDGPAAGLASG